MHVALATIELLRRAGRYYRAVVLKLTLGRVLLLVATLLVWLSPAPALAQKKGAEADGPKKIAVHVEGEKATTFRDMIVSTVPEGVEVVSEGAFTQALRGAGLRGPMGYSVTSPNQRALLLRVIRKAVKNAGLSGAIIGRVRGGRQGLEMVTLYVDESEQLPVDETVSLKGKEEDQKSAIIGALAAVYADIAPPPEPEPEPEPVDDEPDDEPTEDDEEEEDDDDDSEFEPNQPGSELFSVALGAEFGGRFFSYNEACSGEDNPCPGEYRTLRPYDVFGVPGIVVGGEVYPAAPFDIVVLSDLGLTVEYAHFFGLSSATEAGDANFGTSWNRFAAGLKYRFRIGDKNDNPFVIGAAFEFGFQNFTFEPEDPGATAIVGEVGNVEYLFLRGGLDARLPIGSIFAIMPSFGFLGPLSTGGQDAAYDRISGASVLAIDAGLMFAFVLGLGIEIRAGAEYTRYFASFEPAPTDPVVAGGAQDNLLGLRVGAAYVF